VGGERKKKKKANPEMDRKRVLVFNKEKTQGKEGGRGKGKLGGGKPKELAKIRRKEVGRRAERSISVSRLRGVGEAKTEKRKPSRNYRGKKKP